MSGSCKVVEQCGHVGSDRGSQVLNIHFGPQQHASQAFLAVSCLTALTHVASLLAEEVGFVLSLLKAFWSKHFSRTYLAHHELESELNNKILLSL